MIVGIRSTDPDTRQYSPGRHRRTKLPQRPYEHFDISRIVVEKRVLRCTKRRSRIDFTRAIDQTENRIDPSDVNADDQFFHKKDKFYRFISPKLENNCTLSTFFPTFGGMFSTRAGKTNFPNYAERRKRRRSSTILIQRVSACKTTTKFWKPSNIIWDKSDIPKNPAGCTHRSAIPSR